MKRLETDRLILRPWRETDADDLYDYAKRPDVGPNAGWMPHGTRHESLRIIKKFMRSDETWAMESKETSRVIGSIGLHRKHADKDGASLTLGYVLSPDWQGRGLMTEACKTVVCHAFTRMHVRDLVASHFIGNDRSGRVLEKLGFHYEGIKDYESLSYGTLPSKWYRLRRRDWEESQ